MMQPPTAAPEPILVPGRNCWRIEPCLRATAIVDAADYFHIARQAMMAARQRILIIGWDFDTRIRLEPPRRRSSDTLGRFILRLARQQPQRRIAILKWSFGALKQLLHPTALWMLWRWQLTAAIEFRFDSAHPPGCSHHQKLLVLDDQVAVCGGIDMSTARWDTCDHLDQDTRRRLPGGGSYPPWHDITMMMDGPVAKALGELGDDRWYRATSRHLQALAPAPGDAWPAELAPQFQNIMVGIARTRAAYNGSTEIREVEALYLDMIAAARHSIYIENQYFTSAKVAAAIAQRLAQDDPPEIVMIMPRSSSGWLEQMAMDAARVRLARTIARNDPHNRFRIYVPVTEQGQDIYVHAKVAIIDDRLLRIGSSNINNRSLGLDSECDVIIDAGLEQNRATQPAIAAMRTRLLAEHLGVPPEVFAAAFEQHGSLVDAIEALRGNGKTLELLELVPPGPLDQFIADNELMDPESADGFFEPMGRRGLRKHWRQGLQWVRRHRRKHRGAKRPGS